MGFEQSVIEANLEIYKLLRNDAKSELFAPYDTSDQGIGAGGDRSLLVDVLAEKIFIKHLSSYGKINSEECGVVGEGDDEIVIDPIDGSSNIASGFPFFGTSVALKKGKNAHISVVCNLANGDYFVRNENGVYRKNLLSDQEIPLDIGYEPKIGLFEKAYAYPQIAKELKNTRIKFRSPGAVALSLAYAHTVKFVLFVGKHREYDIIAGLHISKDLYQLVNDDFILISKDREVFEQISEILKALI